MHEVIVTFVVYEELDYETAADMDLVTWVGNIPQYPQGLTETRVYRIEVDNDEALEQAELIVREGILSPRLGWNENNGIVNVEQLTGKEV